VLGLIGMGEIGIQMATRATAFGMNLLYHRRRRLNDDLEKEFGLSYRPLVEELISEADIISLHVPYTPETDKLLNSERLRRFKPSAILINTARGGVIDETPLVDMLATGRLAGAGLDVYEYEPLPADSSLLKLNNVVLTPHSAGAGLEPFRQTLLKMVKDIAGMLDAIKEGQCPDENI
jgi:glyoxylate reductase